MNNDLLSRLAELDAAPRTEPSAAEIDREERLLRTVLSDTGKPDRSTGAAFRRPLVRRLAFTTAGALAAGAAVVAVAVAGGLLGGGSGPLSEAQLASWTSTPHTMSTASGEGSEVEKKCLEFTKDFAGAGARPEISNAEIRGSVGSMIVTRAGNATYCLMGSDGSGTGMAVSDVVKLPADQIELDTYGSRGEGDGLLNYALGSAGSDVKEITLHDRGKTIHALVQDGRWTAWWPKGDPEGLLTGTFTLTFKDGTTRTMDASKVE
ncbi:hypothetical protein [Streptomyces spongiae]|uniref:Uncharacterized protein n=1 Tax=Streptomyces spongiae TaxID=565072 RepID=A0A5N8XQM5_9ACTN|nr:hypothetical protein [Streptomyces spongiae]MPY61486.1 hypothetical protein [Streptomyces spongiae]